VFETTDIFVTKPTMLFRLLFSFQRPSCCPATCLLAATDSAIYPNRSNLSSFSFGKFSRFAGGANPKDRSRPRESRTVRYLNPLSFPCRFYSVAKSCAAKSNFITNGSPTVNPFLPT